MKEIKPAILMFIVFTVICGGIYPAMVTGIAQPSSRNRPRGVSLPTKADGLSAPA